MRAALILVLACGSVFGQVAKGPPAPNWMTSADARPGEQFYRRTFEAPDRVLKSILLGACRGEMQVAVNGNALPAITNAERAASIDVSRFIQPGKNVLTIHAQRSNATPEASILLEVNGDLVERRWIISDSSWTSSPAAEAGWDRPDFDDSKWKNVKVTGSVAVAGSNPFDPQKSFDAYDSWRMALGANQATPAEELTLLPGFHAELVRSAQPGEDSWVSFTFDPKGRVILAREQKGLLRLTLDAAGKAGRMESINDSLLECRGLLFSDGDLYANANNSKALFRLRDTNGDGQFEEVTEILRTGGGVGHGRNHVKRGPDGFIYVIHGNNVQLPAVRMTNGPLEHYAPDQLIPCPWDNQMFDGDVELPAGYLIRFDPRKTPAVPEIVAGGMRNPLDIAFNREGEIFTFDADMEWDVGAPWYVPNRILHLVSGADFGWRRGTGRWPAYFADSLPSVVDIGLASPTAVTFGYGAHFPSEYEEALFVLDWAYGRILAIHLESKGSSFLGRQELFASGRPLNVTDACVGPDGALWFTTGGRRTQSGLYRITYSAGKGTRAPALTGSDPAASKVRAIRHRLEGFHRTLSRKEQSEALPFIWSHLDEADVWIRHAARVALEHIDVSLWKPQALEERSPDRALTALLALARVGGVEARDEILERLNALPIDRYDERFLYAARVYEVALARQGKPGDSLARACLARLEPAFPSRTTELNRELCRLLLFFGSPGALPRGIALLRGSVKSDDLLFYLFQLRTVKEGWTPGLRKDYFEALAKADSLQGGRQYLKALADIRREVASSLSESERASLGALVEAAQPAAPTVPTPGSRSVVKEWKLEDLAESLAEISKGRSFARAKSAVIAAQCVVCHRVCEDTSMPAGVTGPDLTSVGRRFNARDMLDHILNPSKVIDEKFRGARLVLKDGSDVEGIIESEDADRIIIRPPLAPQPTTVSRDKLEKREISKISPMPEGLLNSLTRDEILDLIAFLQNGGDPTAAAFR